MEESKQELKGVVDDERVYCSTFNGYYHIYTLENGQKLNTYSTFCAGVNEVGMAQFPTEQIQGFINLILNNQDLIIDMYENENGNDVTMRIKDYKEFSVNAITGIKLILRDKKNGTCAFYN